MVVFTSYPVGSCQHPGIPLPACWNHTLPLYFWKVLSSLRSAQHRLLCFLRATFSPRTGVSFVFKQILSILTSSFNMLYPKLCLALLGNVNLPYQKVCEWSYSTGKCGMVLEPMSCLSSLSFISLWCLTYVIADSGIRIYVLGFTGMMSKHFFQGASSPLVVKSRILTLQPYRK